MNTVRAVPFGILAILVATATYAQKPGVGPPATIADFLGQSVTIGRRQSPTPQFVIGGLAVEVWARVPRPYDVAGKQKCSGRSPAVARAFPGRRDCLTEWLPQSDGRDPSVDVGAAARGVTSLIGSGGGRLVERVPDVEQNY